MEQRREMGEMSGVAKFFISVGLMNTGQYERATTEGTPYWQPLALYEIGNVEEAFERSYEHARAGYPGNLFYLFIRENRDQDLVDYLEERWPSLAAFASEVPADDNGYEVMSSVALAYLRTGNQERYAEAVRFIEDVLDQRTEQGIDNFVFSGTRGIHYALLGDVDAAFDHLELAVERGWRIIGDPVESVPEFANLADDPRFDELKAAMLANANADRELLGLPLFDEDFQTLN